MAETYTVNRVGPAETSNETYTVNRMGPAQQQQPFNPTRAAVGTGTDILTRIAGAPGDIAQTVLGGLNYITGGTVPTLEELQHPLPTISQLKTGQAQPGPLPTSAGFKQFVGEQLPEGYLKPQSTAEKYGREFLGDVASTLAGTGFQLPFKIAAKGSAIINSVPAAAAALGFDENQQDLFKTVTSLYPFAKGIKDIPKLASSAFQKVKNSAKDLDFNISDYNPLRKLANNLRSGASSKEKESIASLIENALPRKEKIATETKAAAKVVESLFDTKAIRDAMGRAQGQTLPATVFNTDIFHAVNTLRPYIDEPISQSIFETLSNIGSATTNGRVPAPLMVELVNKLQQAAKDPKISKSRAGLNRISSSINELLGPSRMTTLKAAVVPVSGKQIAEGYRMVTPPAKVKGGIALRDKLTDLLKDTELTPTQRQYINRGIQTIDENLSKVSNPEFSKNFKDWQAVTEAIDKGSQGSKYVEGIANKIKNLNPWIRYSLGIIPKAIVGGVNLAHKTKTYLENPTIQDYILRIGKAAASRQGATVARLLNKMNETIDELESE